MKCSQDPSIACSLDVSNSLNEGRLVNGSQVGQVDPCGQVGDLEPTLVNSRNLSWVGQVEPVDSCGQVRNIDLAGSK